MKKEPSADGPPLSPMIVDAPPEISLDEEDTKILDGIWKLIQEGRFFGPHRQPRRLIQRRLCGKVEKR